MKFGKYQGLGNDFVLIDDRDNKLKLNNAQVKALAHRQYGVGCDQLMIVKKSRTHDFKMELYNNDGSVAEMCGNGVRCFHRFLIDRGITAKKELRIETLAGTIQTSLAGKLVTVDMGAPILEAADIPMKTAGRIVNQKLVTGKGSFNITAVSMGNPHIVIFRKSLDGLALETVGPMLEHHPLFPKRTNVHFARVDGRKNITVSHWERGAGMTLACGTGACATAVAAVLNGLTDRAVAVHQRGGTLKIKWDAKDNHVYMTGPAIHVFSGEMPV
ncbi:MAG: diaminopimelate epimerase [Nitrospinae bacterium]|nr:diaminopimelate epimerase [Nitrospinota bacterium]